MGIRDKSFPLDLLEASFVLDVTKGKASDEMDKCRILNSLCSEPVTNLDSMPDLTHAKLHTTNSMLRSIFAMAAWPLVVGTDRALHTAELIAADTHRKVVSLSCNSTRHFDLNYLKPIFAL